jgi:hypothetical protein
MDNNSDDCLDNDCLSDVEEAGVLAEVAAAPPASSLNRFTAFT